MSLDLDIYHRLLAGETFVAPLSPRALWKLSGPDATRYLNGQVTNDVALLQDGQAIYAAVCTAKGRMEGDITIAKHGDIYYLDAEAALREGLGMRLDKYLIADDALFEDISDEWNLSHIFGAKTPDVAPEQFAIADARFGLPGHDVWTLGSQVPALGSTLDAEIVETLRLEQGIPKWGAELTATTLPPEAGPNLLAAISYTKGCYVGQETIARLKSVGHVNKTLVFLQSASDQFPAAGTKLLRDEHEVGTVTSSGFSPRLKKGIALAYIQRQHASDGTTLKCGTLELTISPSLAEHKS
jgi:folate-binding protein YgfZ